MKKVWFICLLSLLIQVSQVYSNPIGDEEAFYIQSTSSPADAGIEQPLLMFIQNEKTPGDPSLIKKSLIEGGIYKKEDSQKFAEALTHNAGIFPRVSSVCGRQPLICVLAENNYVDSAQLEQLQKIFPSGSPIRTRSEIVHALKKGEIITAKNLTQFAETLQSEASKTFADIVSKLGAFDPISILARGHMVEPKMVEAFSESLCQHADLLPADVSSGATQLILCALAEAGFTTAEKMKGCKMALESHFESLSEKISPQGKVNEIVALLRVKAITSEDIPSGTN